MLTIQTSHAIDPHRTISQYVRERWGPDRGFPKGPVYSINQTPDGYLWIGTERGLVRFDGLRFVLMPSGNPEFPTLSHVLGLTVDGAGGLWTRLRRPTLLRYDGNVFEDAMVRTGRSFTTATAMTRGWDGSPLLWELNGEGSAMLLRDGKFETVAAPTGFTRSPVLALVQTPDGKVWVGTRDAGLFRLHGPEKVAVLNGLPDPKVNAIVSAGKDQLWIATDAGIVRWDGTKLTTDGVPRSLHGVQALALAVDRDANLWVGTNSGGLIRVNSKGAASLVDTGRESNDAVTAIFEDREGNIWVGSGGGLERLSDSPFVTYSLPEGVPSDGSTPIFAGADGRVWFGPANGGLWWMRDGERGSIARDGLDRDVIYSIAGLKDDLWVGRQHGGLTHVDRQGNSITYTKAHGLAQDSVYSVYQARDGAVWAGTLSGGVSKLSGGRFSNYTVADGLISNTVNAILETSAGTVWIASPIGLSALSRGRWQTYAAGDVNCLLEDSAGVLWIGTAAGLSFRANERIQMPASTPSFLREPVLGLAEANDGSLWIATANHVLRVNREKFQRGAVTEGDMREYGIADGLRGTDGVKRHRSVVADREGRIWFSLNRGISVVDPERMKSDAAPAIAHIQGISADGNPVPIQPSIRLPGGHRRLVIAFAGLSLSVPDRVRFRYRLDDFDRGWSDPTATGEAVYTNLGPGNYRFRVIARNPDGGWNSTEAAVRFRVEPLIWQSWWFRAASLLVLGLATVAGYRYRLRHVTRQMNVRFDERLAERTRIAQELHDTLLQGFISASMQVHVAADQLTEDSHVKPRLTRALQLMRQVIEEGRNAVRGLRSSKSANLEQAFSNIRQEVALSHPGGDEIEFHLIVEGKPRPLHPLLRDDLYRIGREALINAFRHSQANRIEVEIHYSDTRLRVVVRDDGCGIDPQVVATGRDGHWGLSGMSERAARIQSHLSVRSSSGGGTEIELTTPSRVAFEDHRAPRWPWILRGFK